MEQSNEFAAALREFIGKTLTVYVAVAGKDGHPVSYYGNLKEVHNGYIVIEVTGHSLYYIALSAVISFYERTEANAPNIRFLDD